VALPSVERPVERREVERREENATRNLPVQEFRSGLVAATPGRSGFHQRSDARARAEQILGRHPCREGAKCPTCAVDYPCDAVRAAEDVIAICKAIDGSESAIPRR
jgi:hypothetical protein